MLEFSHLDSCCFELFIHSLSQAYPQELHIIQMDNVSAHKAKKIQVPDNVILLFQPPYCPEVNPIERVWQDLKQQLKWPHFDSLEQLQQVVTEWVQQLSPQKVCSLTQWDWILDALSVAGI